jgi:acetyl-CoA acetyltransferase
MRDVAVVSFAQSKSVRRVTDMNEVEMLMPVVHDGGRALGHPEARDRVRGLGQLRLPRGGAVLVRQRARRVGAWPPIVESHVEMDGAFALYEAWVKIQTGEADSALIYAFGKSSLGDIAEILTLQLDPYITAPLWPDAVSLAALQARAFLDASGKSERDLAGVAARSRRDAKANPNAQLAGDWTVEKILADPYLVAPLRKHDCPPISDGAAAIVLAAGDVARKACRKPAWIRGIDHRIEPHGLGLRDLARSRSTAEAGERAGVGKGAVDVAELHAPFTHQELILRDALRLDDKVAVNPSGGALAANPVMVAGLVRIGEAASRIMEGDARRAVAHATSGPCLQQNLVCVLEGDR